jgi:hypothetical protein
VPIDAEKCVKDVTLRDVNHHGSLFVTEVASSYPICTRWNAPPKVVLGRRASHLYPQISASIVEEDPPQLRSHTAQAPFHQSGKDSIRLLSLPS